MNKCKKWLNKWIFTLVWLRRNSTSLQGKGILLVFAYLQIEIFKRYVHLFLAIPFLWCSIHNSQRTPLNFYLSKNLEISLFFKIENKHCLYLYIYYSSSLIFIYCTSVYIYKHIYHIYIYNKLKKIRFFVRIEFFK